MVDSSVSKIRPFVTGIVAKNGTINDQGIKQLMNMQEDLHFGIGRKRKKSSIGLHDLDTISFPLTYTTSTREHSFVPLNSVTESTISESLSNSEVGQNYGWILDDSKNFPIIIDGKGNTISFTPIINPPEVAILGISKSVWENIYNHESKSSEPRYIMPFSLSYDHRIIDGAAAAKFTSAFSKMIEELSF